MHGSRNVVCSRERFRAIPASKIDDLELCSTNSCITLIKVFELYYKDEGTFHSTQNNNSCIHEGQNNVYRN
jgi:hypothetical protein